MLVDSYPLKNISQAQLGFCLGMALVGALLGLSAPGYGCWCLAWLAIAPALVFTYQTKSMKTIALGGFLYGFCFQALYCLWFLDLHPLTWLGFTEIGSRLITFAGWLLIAAEGGILCLVFFLAAKRLRTAIARLILIPVVWTFLFGLLNLTPLALPWGLLEYTQSALWPMRWLAGHIGNTGMTMLLVFYNTLLAEGLKRLLDSKRGRVSLVFALSAFIPVACLYTASQQALSSASQELPGSLMIVQGNLPIELIRSGNLDTTTIEKAYLNPIRTATLPRNSLVLLPEEGVVPGIVRLNKPWQNPFFHALQTLAHQKQSVIAVGVSTQDQNQHLYNSIALISPQFEERPQFYHKRRLVPFGEYTPYGWGPTLEKFLSHFQVHYSAPFKAGTQGQVLQTNPWRLGPLMCFELIDPTYSAAYQAQKAQLLINLSNLGWFHQNRLIEAQFLAIGQMRAAESQTPVVIASNTGISAIINAQGDLLRHTQPSKPEVLPPIHLHSFQRIFYQP